MASTSLPVRIVGTQILVRGLSSSYTVVTFPLHSGSNFVLFAPRPEASVAESTAVVEFDEAFMATLPHVDQLLAHVA